MKQKNFPNEKYHLGGHAFVTHIDTGMLEYFKQDFKIKSFLDVGCGPGGMVYEALSNGLDAIGIDGDYRLERKYPQNFILHDFTEGPCKLNKFFDLAYSCEFVEHVEERYLDNYMKSFLQAKHILMTFAPEGTPGHHHVNCKNEEYWINIFESYGFVFNRDLTTLARQSSTMKRNFVRNYGLYFSNEN